MNWLAVLFLLCTSVLANKVLFDETMNSQVCGGMYAKHDWGGSLKPHIGLRLNQFGKDHYDSNNKDAHGSEDVLVSYVIFEYKDIDNLGADVGGGRKKYICDSYAIDTLKICDKKQEGNFIINADVTNSTIMTSHINKLGPVNLDYSVNKTGYYCVSTFNKNKALKYKGVVNFQNAFGQLSASEIPKLPAYGILTLCYAIALALYGFQFFKKRNEHQILPLQRYLLAMLGFLTFDTLVVWSYFDLVNRTKNPLSGFVTFYMVFLSMLNAAKITFCFFLLLCIALGYGVVVLKLSKKIMFRCKILAGVHFLASFFYLLATYYSSNNSVVTSNSNAEDDPEFNEIKGLIPLIPISITLTIYYVATLVSIKKTTANLHKQRQIIKLQLYENLFRIIFLSVLLTFGGLILSSFIYLSMSSTQMIEEHWKGSYFIFEFWPSVVFFAVFMGVSWLWRPTETSYMLAISQQVATDDNIDENGTQNAGQGYHEGHEFELDDLSLLSHSDNDLENGRNNNDDDSFELGHNSSNTTRNDAPPKYEETDLHKKSTSHESDLQPTGSNTLFELGDDDNDPNKSDDRLRESK